MQKRSRNNPKKKRKKRNRGRNKLKPGRSFLEKCPETFGLGTLRKWSKHNPCGPDEVSANCHDICMFDCSGCNHTIYMTLANIMNGQSCGHCNNSPRTPLCGELDCDYCLKKSFAYVPNNDLFLQQKLREFKCMPCNPEPHTVKKSSGEKFHFQCEICPHVFKMTLGHVTNHKAGCGFCANRQRCGDPGCAFCLAHSVACNPVMLTRWDTEKNTKTPYEVALNDCRKYWWECEHNHSYEQRAKHANKGHGCSDCYKKTEALLREFFTEQFGTNCLGTVSFDWCKNIRRLPFDFHLKQYKIIVECDGPQHYEPVKHFNRTNSLQDIQLRDSYKEISALNQGYCLIRIKQEDVWNDRNNWRNKLLSAIERCKNSYETFVEKLY